jgi:23S rRNA pseudouridine2604 synthase
MDGTAVKVSPDEKYIEIRAGGDPPDESEGLKECSPYAQSHWDKIRGDTIVLNKPIGYVSGQEEHQHVPAVRLLTRDNMHLDGLNFDKATQHTLRHGSIFNFAKWKFSGFDKMANSVPRHIREQLTEGDPQLREKSKVIHETLAGYAPAGRLDIDSTGVLIFTQAGIMARRLIQPETTIPKEYIVKVKPVIQPTSREIEMGLMRLPRPNRDLRGLLKKGNRLWNEKRPLKPLLRAEWLDDDTMRLVLVEGKKRQIRRMCRELLGWHVVSLCRTSVGPVRIDSLPEGKWRPLTQEEVKSIFEEQK